MLPQVTRPVPLQSELIENSRFPGKTHDGFVGRNEDSQLCRCIGKYRAQFEFASIGIEDRG